jgi:N-acetylglutamate synthase-like GNAT family acetyltransferase
MRTIVNTTSAERIIREITDDELKKSARVIRDSFKTVAVEFGLTRENSPTHASFTTVRHLRKLKEKGIGLFGLFIEEKQIGFVAIEKADSDTYYLEKLAVLPKYRHRGYGEELVKFVTNRAKNENGRRLSISIIDGHTILKNWYKRLGFRETTKKKFPQFYFTACFMEMVV